MINQKKNYETELPEGYAECMVIDAKNLKLGIILNVVALIPFIIVIAIILAFCDLGSIFEPFTRGFLGCFYMLCFIIVMLLYIVLHELVHGVAYKLMTGQKLTFGMTLTVAYCGVPDIYVYRKAALIALLAPFVVFTVIFGLLTLFLPTAFLKVLAGFLLAIHLGGCSGDLYDTLLYLTRFKSSSTLMRDTGPKQTFYQKNITDNQKNTDTPDK